MGQTPADNETKLGILAFEELNYHEGLALSEVWDFLIKNKKEPLDTLLLNKAHKFGFHFLYDWAGCYRTSNPMVGTLKLKPFHSVSQLMKDLFDDLNYKSKNIKATGLTEVVELIAWFEHRFVWVHPYKNTNGRMARLLSNYILVRLKYPPLDYSNRSKRRISYINSMRKADEGDYSKLENMIAEELDKAIKLYK